MLQESKDIIIKNFVTLMKECNENVLKDLLIQKGVFSETEIRDIFSTPDLRHNKRVLFFNIQKKEQRAFNILVECLRETNQHKIANILLPEVRGCKSFNSPPNLGDTPDVAPVEKLPIHINPNENRLTINVVYSETFYDTPTHNKVLDFYSSRSKKRGKVLIINNYEYHDGNHKYRNGAIEDNKNLHDLFTQMGGWEIHHYDNKTGEEMNFEVTEFVHHPDNKEFDICFVIIMGHGQEENNKTIIYGVDGRSVDEFDIQNKFTNEKCIGFRGKPKIFLFQVCRGYNLDHTIRHTETDSLSRPSATALSTVPAKSSLSIIRTQEDMLIGYATLHGYKAHRDPFRGSWYIELICEKFMHYAHNHSVQELLQLVDEGLRTRMSEKHTMQTSEHRYKGFKSLYLNPGIYYEDDKVKRFH